MLLVNLLPVAGLCLIASIWFLNCIVWQLRAIEALQPDRLTIENTARVEVTQRHAA